MTTRRWEYDNKHNYLVLFGKKGDLMCLLSHIQSSKSFSRSNIFFFFTFTRLKICICIVIRKKILYIFTVTQNCKSDFLKKQTIMRVILLHLPHPNITQDTRAAKPNWGWFTKDYSKYASMYLTFVFHLENQPINLKQSNFL